MAERQRRRPRPLLYQDRSDPKAGLTVDAYGSEAVDPTENVLALVDAQAKFQEQKDELVAKFNAAECAWIIKYFESLAAQKERFDKQISDTQTTQLKTTSDLVSATQTKMENSISDSMDKNSSNTAEMLRTIDKRLSAIEQFRYETGGRSSVADPATEMRLATMAARLEVLAAAGERGAGGHQAVADTSTRLVAFIALILTAVMMVVAIVSAFEMTHH